MNFCINNIEHAETFLSIFKEIKTFTQGVNINFEEKRFYIQSLDSSSVMLFEIILPKTWFDVYELEDNIALNVGVNVNVFNACLQTRGDSQAIEITYLKNDDKLNIVLPIDEIKEDESIITTKKKTKKTKEIKETKKTFKINTIDLQSDMMNISDIEYDAEFTIQTERFSKSINSLKGFGEELIIECSEGIIQLKTFEEQGTFAMEEISVDDLESFSIVEGIELKVGYSLKYLENICKYCKIAKTMDIMISPNAPMKIVFYLTDNEHDEKIVFYLAPRFDDN